MLRGVFVARASAKAPAVVVVVAAIAIVVVVGAVPIPSEIISAISSDVDFPGTGGRAPLVVVTRADVVVHVLFVIKTEI